MDIKIINSNKEEVYIPLQGIDISEDNGMITIKSGFQFIGRYKILPCFRPTAEGGLEQGLYL